MNFLKVKHERLSYALSCFVTDKKLLERVDVANSFANINCNLQDMS